jgi:hypothetical protein
MSNLRSTRFSGLERATVAESQHVSVSYRRSSCNVISQTRARPRPEIGPAEARRLPRLLPASTQAGLGVGPGQARARPYRSYVGMKAMGRVAVKAGLKRSVRAMPSMSRATGRPSR